MGERIRAWAFEHGDDAIRTALAEITAAHEDAVLGDADLALIACWGLNDRICARERDHAVLSSDPDDLVALDPTLRIVAL